MDAAAYRVESEVEAEHWWFAGRRRLFARYLKRAPVNAHVLDVGCGTGANLQLLSDMQFKAVGLDANSEAIRFCAAKGLSARLGSATDLPFPDQTFDVVLATDVIEHLEDDAKALREIARVLKKGGLAIITVPAFKSLWGRQDEIAHHKRRYLKRDLLHTVRISDLKPLQSFYFNYLLFLPILAVRRAIAAGVGVVPAGGEGELNPPALNWLLSRIFAFDVATAHLVRPPFGVSIFVLATR